MPCLLIVIGFTLLGANLNDPQDVNATPGYGVIPGYGVTGDHKPKPAPSNPDAADKDRPAYSAVHSNDKSSLEPSRGADFYPAYSPAHANVMKILIDHDGGRWIYLADRKMYRNTLTGALRYNPPGVANGK